VRVVVASGIWPPDVGGPASNAPEVAAFLCDRGHAVCVLTTASAPPAPEAYPIRWIPRSLTPGVRHLRFAWELARLARHADVVYTASVLGRSALGCALVGTPFVVRLPDDPAFERARRLGLARGDLDEFQAARGAAVGALKALRTIALHRAAHVLTPSEYLRGLVLRWGIAPERVTVLPNPAPAVDRAASPSSRDGFVFAGRLNAQKSLATALEALARVDGASLVVAGDGPQRESLERRARDLGLDGRVRFIGPQPRERVLELLRGAEAAVLSSAWENFPHTAVEALAVGTPVIAIAVGGVTEIVRDGHNGLLVPAGDTEALAGALQRFCSDPGLRERLGAAAAASVERLAPDRIYPELERILERAR
jgi:glycosyltransferase involved in cell wall biosynthesis